jgi:hypothetical protein
MTTICGHEREKLIWALHIRCAEDDSVLGVPPYPMHNQPMSVQRADADLADPAKLAELLAEALRERGVDASVFLYGVDRADGGEDVRIWRGYVNGQIQVSVGRSVRSSHSRMFTLAEFRAALLRVLSLPDGATAEDAVKVVSQ